LGPGPGAGCLASPEDFVGSWEHRYVERFWYTRYFFLITDNVVCIFFRIPCHFLSTFLPFILGKVSIIQSHTELVHAQVPQYLCISDPFLHAKVSLFFSLSFWFLRRREFVNAWLAAPPRRFLFPKPCLHTRKVFHSHTITIPVVWKIHLFTTLHHPLTIFIPCFVAFLKITHTRHTQSNCFSHSQTDTYMYTPNFKIRQSHSFCAHHTF
jgi:hypothetical protein